MKLLSHPFDCVRICPTCGHLTEARYEGAQILPVETGELAECRLYTCAGCGSTYSADPEPRPDATEADNMRVTDRRAWAALRNARMRGLGTTTVQGVAPPAVTSAPGPTSRGVLPTDAGRYRLVGRETCS